MPLQTGKENWIAVAVIKEDTATINGHGVRSEL